MEIAPLTAEAAAAAMRARGVRAPLPCHTPESIARHAQCFAFRDGEDLCVFAVRRQGDVLWIDGGAAMRGEGIAEKGFQLARALAREMGCKTVAFETARRGLVRVAEREGFEVRGWVLAQEVGQ